MEKNVLYFQLVFKGSVVNQPPNLHLVVLSPLTSILRALIIPCRIIEITTISLFLLLVIFFYLDQVLSKTKAHILRHMLT